MERNTQLLLITCPRRWPRLPPLGEACLKSYLDSNGIHTDVLDMNNYCYSFVNDELKRLWELPVYPMLSDALWDHLMLRYKGEFQNILRAIIDHPAQTIGLSIWHSAEKFSHKLAKYVRENAPLKRIIAGGPSVTLSSLEKNLSKTDKFIYADHCIAGEGEYKMLRYLTKKETNNVNKNDFKESDADSLPAPDYTQIYPRAYRYPRTRPVWMSRGCVRRCAFCVEHTLSKRYRQKSPELMVSELRDLYERQGIQHVIFYDSLINGNIVLFERFLDLLIDSRLPMKWEGQLLIRSDMPERVYHKMKPAGCYNLFVGLESGCDRILSIMKKGFSTKDAQKSFATCREAGLHFEVSMIAGFPGETEADFDATCEFMCDNASIIPKMAQINPFIPLSGSPVVRQGDGEVQCPPKDVVRRRIERLVALCKSNGIAVTNAYVNNLIAQTAGFDVINGTMIE